MLAPLASCSSESTESVSADDSESSTAELGTAPAKGPCLGKKCGASCPSMFGSPLPTFCNAKGECRPGAPVCVSDHGYDCDLSLVKCDAPQPSCKDGMTPSVVGSCYGACVSIGSCECEPGKPSQCPDGYVCWASTKRCGPYVQ